MKHFTPADLEGQKRAIYAFFSMLKEEFDPAIVREAFAAMGFKVVPVNDTKPPE